jgi:hypothetical protein
MVEGAAPEKCAGRQTQPLSKSVSKIAARTRGRFAEATDPVAEVANPWPTRWCETGAGAALKAVPTDAVAIPTSRSIAISLIDFPNGLWRTLACATRRREDRKLPRPAAAASSPGDNRRARTAPQDVTTNEIYSSIIPLGFNLSGVAMRSILAALVGAALTGCAMGPPITDLPSEQGNSSYRIVTLSMGSGHGLTLNSSQDVKVYLRFFERDQNLAMCGFYTIPATMDQTTRGLMGPWLAGAVIYSGETALSPAKFLYERTPRSNEFDAQATCVKTAVTFTSFHDSIRFVGTVVRGDM